MFILSFPSQKPLVKSVTQTTRTLPITLVMQTFSCRPHFYTEDHPHTPILQTGGCTILLLSDSFLLWKKTWVLMWMWMLCPNTPHLPLQAAKPCLNSKSSANEIPGVEEVTGFYTDMSPLTTPSLPLGECQNLKRQDSDSVTKDTSFNKGALLCRPN